MGGKKRTVEYSDVDGAGNPARVKTVTTIRGDKKIVKQDKEEFISFEQQELFFEHRDNFYNTFKVSHWSQE